MGRVVRMWRVVVAVLVTLVLGALVAAPGVHGARTPSVWLFATARTYLPGDTPELGVRGWGVRKMQIDIYRFDAQEHFENGGPDAMWNIDPKGLAGKKLVRTVPVPVAKPGGNLQASVKLSPLPQGSYVAVTRSPELRWNESTWFTVSSIGLIAKQSGSRILVHAVDLRSGEPAPGVSVSVRAAGMNGGTIVIGDGSRGPIGSTDSDGMLMIDLPEVAPSALVIGSRGSDYAVLYSFYWWDARTRRVYIYTDRPVYRPGNSVYFKGIARGQDDAGYSVISGRPVNVEIRDSRGNAVSRYTITTNEWGSFDGKFVLGPEPPLGRYSICATIEGEQHWGYFDVAEYRKPEWSVDVKCGRDIYIAGDEVDATVEALYYFGQPVAGASVTYRVYRQDVGFLGTGSAGGADAGEDSGAYWDDEADSKYGLYYGQLITQGTAMTDESGHAKISFSSPKAGGSNYRAIIEVDVADATNKQASGRGTAMVARGSFDVRVSAEKYIVGVGDAFGVKLRTAGIDGSPVSRKLTVETMKRTYTKKGFIDKPVSSQQTETSSAGEARVEFTASQAGTIVIVARDVDERGNEIVSEEYVWATEAHGSWPEPRHDVAVITDKSKYSPGESAQVLITAPAEVNSALLTIEDSEIRHAQVVSLEGGTAQVVLPIVDGYAPNTFVCVTAVVDGAMQTAAKPIAIDAPGKLLNVKIQPNKPSYRPGDKATFIVTTENADGDGVPSEFSFALVDESIYAVKPDTTTPIQSFFHGKRSNSVTTENSFPITYYGGAGKEGGAEATRKYFPDTAVWLPSMLTDANGRKVVEVTIPDSLTTWRATVKAHSRTTMVGQAEAKITVNLPLLVRLSPPRHYVVGDKAVIAGVVHNYTKRARRVGVTLAADGATIVGRAKKYVTVQPGGQALVEWNVEPSAVGEVKFQVRARSWFITDAMELSVPVLPFGEPEEAVGAGEIVPGGRGAASSGGGASGEASGGTATASLKFEMPAAALQGASRASVEISPGYAGVVQAALEYLVNYPYGCVEQTMSSFIPDVVAHEAFSRLGLSMPRGDDELAGMVNSGLARLYKYQHSDSGFGWWENDKSDPWMTSYVLFGLSRAVRAGFDVSGTVISGALDYLRAWVADPAALSSRSKGQTRSRALSERDYAFACYVLAEHDAMKKDARKQFDKFALEAMGGKDGVGGTADAQTTAFIALAYSALDDSGRSAAACARLEKMAVRVGGRAYWKTEDVLNPWRNETAESTSWALMALLGCAPDSALIPEAALHLAMSRSGSQWRSTRESAAAVMALVDYMTAHGGDDQAASRTVTVNVNGVEAAKVAFSGADELSSSKVVEIDGKLLRPGENLVSLSAEGGTAYYSARASWYVPADGVEARGESAEITREYLRIDRGATPAKGQRYATRPFDGEAREGEELLVRVTIKANSNLEYMAFEDPIPSGFEISEEFTDPYSWDFWYDRREARDTKMVVFASWIPAGEVRVFEYVVTPERSGAYRVMPTQAWSMYYPDLKARGSSDEITVVSGR